MKEDSIYTDLISKYLSGNATEGEVTRLEEWVAADVEHRDRFKAMKRAWVLSGVGGNAAQIEVDKEWEAMSGQLFGKAKIASLPAKGRSRRMTYLGIAAAVAILVALSLWLFRPAPSLEFMAENTPQEQELPDGTRISLNQYAAINFVNDAKNGYRRVELTGDAFFDVQRDTLHPFVIRTQNLEIEVLGTSFYVDSREDQPTIKVIVASGSVALKGGEQSLILTANETGIFDKYTGQLEKTSTQDVNYMAWKTGRLVFDNANLETVVYALNRSFHTQISLANPALKACEITATYDQQSLPAILRIIEKTLTITAETKGDQIVLSGQGCAE